MFKTSRGQDKGQRGITGLETTINLTPPYSVDDASLDSDVVSGAQNKTIVTYSDANQHLSDLPWSITWPRYSDDDNVLDPGE